MSGDITPYTSLITSEHAIQPNYMAMIAATVQGYADNIEVADSMPGLFDLDVAVGQQLDFTGQWIGATRDVIIAVSTLYFQYDTSGQGWDQGVWWDGATPTTEITVLADPQYRALLYAVAASNSWDGTIPGAYAVWNSLFEPLGYTIEITDNGNMTVGLDLVGPAPDNVTKALYENGYLNIVPAGVAVSSYKINGV